MKKYKYTGRTVTSPNTGITYNAGDFLEKEYFKYNEIFQMGDVPTSLEEIHMIENRPFIIFKDGDTYGWTTDFERIDSTETACNCDIFTVLMVTGCKCGGK